MLTEQQVAPSLRRLVDLLVSNGFDVTDNADGEGHGMCEESYSQWDRPMVAVMPKAPGDLVEDAHRLMNVLAAHGVPVDTQGPGDDPCIQASYDPGNGSSVIAIIGVTDKHLAGDETTAS